MLWSSCFVQPINSFKSKCPWCQGTMCSRLHHGDTAQSQCPHTSADSNATQSCPLIWFVLLSKVARVSSAPSLQVPVRGHGCSDNSKALREWKQCQLTKQKLSMAMCWPKDRIKGLGNSVLSSVYCLCTLTWCCWCGTKISLKVSGYRPYSCLMPPCILNAKPDSLIFLSKGLGKNLWMGIWALITHCIVICFLN